jgi:hypothetical protein
MTQFRPFEQDDRSSEACGANALARQLRAAPTLSARNLRARARTRQNQHQQPAPGVTQTGAGPCRDRRAEVRWPSALCTSAARRRPTADGFLVTGWRPPGSWLESGVGSRLARCEFGESSGLVGLHRLPIPANHLIADDDHWATLPSRGFEKRRPVGITLDIDLGVREAAGVKEPFHPSADLRRLCGVYRDLRHAPPRSVALPPRV